MRRERLVDERAARVHADARAEDADRRGVVVEDRRERGRVRHAEIAHARAAGGEVLWVAREEKALCQLPFRVTWNELRGDRLFVRLLERGHTDQGRCEQGLGRQRRSVDERRRTALCGRAREEPDAGSATLAALERHGGVEADERGALVVAGVLVGLRVAVEVPARQRGGERATE